MSFFRPVIPIEEVEECLSHYPAIGTLHRVTPMEGGFHNTLYQITSTEGDYFLKVLTTHFLESTEERYEYVASVMERVAALGVQVPLPVRNDQHLRLTPCGEFEAVLSAAVRGDSFDEESLEHQAAAGRLLGRFHGATADFAPRGTCWPEPLGAYLILDRSLADSLPDTAQAATISEFFDDLVERSLKIERELEECGYHELPRVIIHCEYSGKHLRMRGDEIVGLLDFEYTCRDARILDIALALERLFCIGPEAADSGLERARAFLAGYNSCAPPLRSQELAAVPVMVKTWHFECITFWVHYVIRTGKTVDLFDMRDRITRNCGRVDWWDQHGAECAAALLGLGS